MNTLAMNPCEMILPLYDALITNAWTVKELYDTPNRLAYIIAEHTCWLRTSAITQHQGPRRIQLYTVIVRAVLW